MFSNFMISNFQMFKFKYFQDLAGKIRIPVDFQPEKAAIVVRSAGGRSLVERELDWRLDS